MGKRDIQRARSRARARAIGEARAVAANAPLKPKVVTKTYVNDTGLAWLKSKRAISSRQATAGEVYGQLFRTDILGGTESLRSCLDFSPSGQAGAKEVLGKTETAEWVADCRTKLLGARQALGFHAGMIATCDLICGRGLRPREITTTQSETEEIVNTLRIALDLLETHFAEQKAEKRKAA